MRAGHGANTIVTAILVAQRLPPDDHHVAPSDRRTPTLALPADRGDRHLHHRRQQPARAQPERSLVHRRPCYRWHSELALPRSRPRSDRVHVVCTAQDARWNNRMTRELARRPRDVAITDFHFTLHAQSVLA